MLWLAIISPTFFFIRFFRLYNFSNSLLQPLFLALMPHVPFPLKPFLAFLAPVPCIRALLREVLVDRKVLGEGGRTVGTGPAGGVVGI